MLMTDARVVNHHYVHFLDNLGKWNGKVSWQTNPIQILISIIITC